MAIDLPRALTFAARDAQWTRKLMIGAALSAVPFFNLFAVGGYATTVARNVQTGVDDSEVQPDWGNFGELLFKGLMAGGVVLCYAAVFGLLNLVVAMPAGMAAVGLKQGGVPVPSGVLLGAVSVVFFLAASVVSLAALSLFAETGEFGSAFSPGELFARLAAAPRDWAVIVGLWAGGALVTSLASFIPYVGVLLSGALMFPVTLATFHAMGQVMADVSPPVVVERPKFTPAAAAEPGGSKPASAFADGTHETVLTWSTDSDRPDQD